ncbi:MAG: MazG family protein [Candidatus Bipolaricaulota bacterium]
MSPGLERLVDLVARLRDPVHGCPWDLQQDHASLRPYVVEEAYEVVGAIDAGSSAALAGELGDLLLQVLLHARIAEESGAFTLEDVFAGLEAKLMRRHPHVFGDAPADLESIRARWEAIKASEPCHSSRTLLPTLLAARRAASQVQDPLAWSSLASSRDRDVQVGAELLVRLRDAWREGVDPDLALRKAIDSLERIPGREEHGAA